MKKFPSENVFQRFGVSKSLIQTLIKKYQETGALRPWPQAGSPPDQLNSEELVILVEIMEKNHDPTLEELCELLEAAFESKWEQVQWEELAKNSTIASKKT